MRVILLDLVDLCELKLLNDIFNVVLVTPADKVLPHHPHIIHDKLPRTTEPEQIVIIIVHRRHIATLLIFDPCLELSEHLILLGRCVPHEA